MAVERAPATASRSAAPRAAAIAALATAIVATATLVASLIESGGARAPLHPVALAAAFLLGIGAIGAAVRAPTPTLGLAAGCTSALTAAVYAAAAVAPSTPVEVVASAGASFWHVPVLLLLQLTTLRAATAPVSRSLVAVVASGALLVIATGMIAGPPDGRGIPWLLPRPSAAATISDVASMVCANVWLATLLVTPVVLWVRVHRAPPTARRQPIVAAIASLVTLLVVALCGALAVAVTLGGLGLDLSYAALALGLPASALMTLLVLTPSGSRSPRAPTASLTAVVVLFALLGATTAAVALGASSPAWVVAAASALVLLLLIAGGLAVLRGIRSVWDQTPAEPSRAQAAVDHQALPALTPREREVLALLAEGHSNAGIASRLHNSIRTIEAHVRSIFAKLGLEQDPDANQRVRAARQWLSDTRDR